MRNLLALAALGLIIFLGMGWYLGWYNVHTGPTTDGHTHIEVDLNTGKIKTDVGKGEEKLHDILNPTQQSTGTPPPTSATPTSYRTGDDGSIVFPAASPPPPGGGATLPAPR